MQRHVEAELLRRLQVDDQLEFRRRLNRQVGRLFAFEDAIDVGCDAPINFDQISPIRQQRAASRENAEGRDRRQAMAVGQHHDGLAVREIALSLKMLAEALKQLVDQPGLAASPTAHILGEGDRTAWLGM